MNQGEKHPWSIDPLFLILTAYGILILFAAFIVGRISEDAAFSKHLQSGDTKTQNVIATLTRFQSMVLGPQFNGDQSWVRYEYEILVTAQEPIVLNRLQEITYDESIGTVGPCMFAWMSRETQSYITRIPGSQQVNVVTECTIIIDDKAHMPEMFIMQPGQTIELRYMVDLKSDYDTTARTQYVGVRFYGFRYDVLDGVARRPCVLPMDFTTPYQAFEGWWPAVVPAMPQAVPQGKVTSIY